MSLPLLAWVSCWMFVEVRNVFLYQKKDDGRGQLIFKTHHRSEVGVVQNVAIVVHSERVPVDAQLKLNIHFF